jgi:hypothetical protein
MKVIDFGVMTLCVFSGLAFGATLDELINKNIEGAANATISLSQPQSIAATSVRLWVHVRSSAQIVIGNKIIARITSGSPSSLLIERKPIQLVSQGPSQTQLRFFKSADEAVAQDIAKRLKPMIGDVDIQDFSERYKTVDWIKPGHLELWLSPQVSQILN